MTKAVRSKALVGCIRIIYSALKEVGMVKMKGIRHSDSNGLHLEFHIRHSKKKIKLLFTTFQRHDAETLGITLVIAEESEEIATKMVEHVSKDWLKEKIGIALKKAARH